VLSSLDPCDTDPQVSLTFGGKQLAVPVNSFNIRQAAPGSTDCVGGVVAAPDIDCVFGFFFLLSSSGVLTTLNSLGSRGRFPTKLLHE
jgi:hypothetical protein